MERMMTAREVAEYTRIPVQVIYRKTKSGDLPSYRLGRSVRYKRAEIEQAMKGDFDAKKDGTERRGNSAEQFYQKEEAYTRG